MSVTRKLPAISMTTQKSTSNYHFSAAVLCFIAAGFSLSLSNAFLVGQSSGDQRAPYVGFSTSSSSSLSPCFPTLNPTSTSTFTCMSKFSIPQKNSLCEGNLRTLPWSASAGSSFPTSASVRSSLVRHASTSIVMEGNNQSPSNTYSSNQVQIDYNDPSRKKNVLITGANSGIGLDAAKKLTDKGYNVYVVCRNEQKCIEAQKKSGAYGYGVCDLSSLESIDKFVEAWGKERPIDILVLNAGLAWGSKDKMPRYTKEGFEETVGVNHFGHFYLATNLLQNVELAAKKNNFEKDKKREKARIVITASSVHDPDTAGGDIGAKASLGDLRGLRQYLKQGQFTMVDGSEYSADKTYKDSKLCNVFFTRELSRRINGNKSSVDKDTSSPYITVNCFSPGLIPSSGLFRAQNPLFTSIFSFLSLYILGFAVPVSTGGDCLTYMCDSEELDNETALFLATPPGKPKEKFGVRSISVEASDEQKQIEFWRLSEEVLAFAKSRTRSSSTEKSGIVSSK